jgi:hypothetical protein
MPELQEIFSQIMSRRMEKTQKQLSFVSWPFRYKDYKVKRSLIKARLCKFTK